MTIKRRRWLAGHALLRYAPSFDPRGGRFRCDELDVQHLYRGYAIKVWMGACEWPDIDVSFCNDDRIYG
ncbi:hypothetical protein K439DRAFT_1637826, partial [Ramaria rubella]